MLANCYSKELLASADCPKNKEGYPRQHSYYNHPCSIWVRSSLSNFNWLVEHAIEMINEKIYRSGKGHFSSTFILWCKENKPNIPDIGLTTPAQAFGDYKHLIDKNPLIGYRQYYIIAKKYNKSGKEMHKWSRRQRPWWFD